MKAVLYERYGQPENVVDIVERFPRTFIDLDSDHVLVRVHAASLTYKDLREVRGDFRSVGTANTAQLPAVLGCDVSGVIEAVGRGCKKLRVGDEVIGIVNGSMAEYVSAPEPQWVRKPKRVSHLHAAAFPYCGVLAFQCLFVHGHLKEKQRILVLNGSGGVGSMAVQMARYKGATVYATTSKHVELVKSLGAHHVLDYTKCQWFEQLRGANIDLILDCGVGYAAWIHCEQVLNPVGGRFLSIVTDAPDGPVDYVGYRFGATLREYSSKGVYKLVKEVDLKQRDNRHLAYVAKLVQNGFLKPVLDPDSPFEFTIKGVQRMMVKLGQKHTRGKLIVSIAGPGAASVPV